MSAVSFVSVCLAASGVSPAEQRVRPGDALCPAAEKKASAPSEQFPVTNTHKRIHRVSLT